MLAMLSKPQFHVVVLADDGAELFRSACCMCSAMTFPHSTNDIVALSLPLPSVMLKLPNMIG